MKTTKQILFESNKFRKTRAYICWLFGIHYIYLEKFRVFVLYVLTLGGFGIWTIVDLFRIPKMVRLANLELMHKYGLDE